jgi:hemerythrin-like domain-containing protein
MINKPIKRSGYVVALSRDHHAGLLFCWKIKEGLKKNVAPDRIKNYISFFWNGHLKPHFQEEELLLFNQLNCELTRKAGGEHQILTKKIEEIIKYGLAAKQEYRAFAEDLINHIRFEERELFPYLETKLPGDMLAGIKNILTKLHQEPFNDNYPDEFWNNKDLKN